MRFYVRRNLLLLILFPSKFHEWLLDRQYRDDQVKSQLRYLSLLFKSTKEVVKSGNNSDGSSVAFHTITLTHRWLKRFLVQYKAFFSENFDSVNCALLRFVSCIFVVCLRPLLHNSNSQQCLIKLIKYRDLNKLSRAGDKAPKDPP